MIQKTTLNQSPNIGIFSNSNNEVTLIPPTTPEGFRQKIKETLNTEILETTISNSTLIGVFTALNNEKIIVPPTTTEREEKNLQEYFNEVVKIQTKYTAIGNLITMNDTAIAASNIINTDKLNLKNLDVAGTDLIGSCVFLNNEGFLAHREADKEELESIEEVFKVEGEVGTVNFGDPYVNTGILGNDEGILVGNQTTGPELNRIDEIFMLK